MRSLFTNVHRVTQTILRNVKKISLGFLQIRDYKSLAISKMYFAHHLLYDFPIPKLAKIRSTASVVKYVEQNQLPHSNSFTHYVLRTHNIRPTAICDCGIVHIPNMWLNAPSLVR